jgi:pilus assembly protein CpaE
MHALIVGSHAVTNEALRRITSHSDFECTIVDAATINDDGAARRLACELVLVHVSPLVPESLDALRWYAREPESIVVAVGPLDDPMFILGVMREGADEYVGETEVDSELEMTLLRLRKRGLPRTSGTLLGVIGATGGSGATSVVTNLAVSLAQRKKRVGLVDLRIAADDIRLLLDLKPQYTLADLCQNYQRMDSSMLQQSLVRHESGLHLLAAAPDRHEHPVVHAHGVNKVLNHLQILFSHTVVEIDRRLDEEQRPAITSADALLVVTRLDMVSLHHTQRILDQLDRMNFPIEQVGIVVNRLGQPKDLSTKRAEMVLPCRFFHLIPNDPKRMNLSLNKGVPVVLDKPYCRLARSLAQLAEKTESLCAAKAPNSGRSHAAWKSAQFAAC